jgi:2-dehydro-3-deoxygluconokinase
MTVLTFGETMALASAVGTGPLAHTSTLDLSIGGSESNVAIALRRLGTPVTWIGRVGRDSFGDAVERQLRAEQLVVEVIRDPDAPTGLMVKERRTATATRVWYYRADSAGSRLSAGDIPAATIDAASLLHITGITPALSASALAAVRHGVDRARRKGIPVSFDLNYRRALWSADQARPVFRELMSKADIVFAGLDEAAIAVGEGEPLDLAARISELGPTEAIIKLGGQGCLATIDGQVFKVPAVDVPVVDSVGAGDGFVAGYLAEHCAGEGPERRLHTAVTVGAFACTVSGDWEGMPRRDELDLLTGREPVTR